ncbi:MAG: ankyrin repeat protein [Bradymonadia bacterium]|jgi:ankyrin repeat protein
MSDSPFGLTPLHMAVLTGDHAGAAALLPDKAAVSAKTTEMLTSHARPRDARIFRPGSATFYPPDVVDMIGPNRAFDKGARPLHLAAAIGDLAAVELLLAHKARPAAKDGVGATPLHLAALGGHTKILQRLLTAKIDVNAVTKVRKSIRFLDAGTTPLLAALESGSIAVVEALLAQGANAHVVTKDGVGAILFAALGGSVACLDAMVAAGVSVKYEPESMNFPLEAAAEQGHVDLALRLIALGAPSETDLGYQALRAAVVADDRVMRQALLDAGLRPLPDHGLESAIRGNDYMYVQAWLDAGNDPNDGGKGSHLWIAAATGKAPIVELLLERGADVNARHKEGTALEVALQNDYPAIADRLLDARPDCSSDRSLGCAIFGQHVSLARVARILECGANPHSVGRRGQSLIESAQGRVDPAVMAMLKAVDAAGAIDRAWRRPAESAALRDATPETSWRTLHAALWEELVPPRHAADTVQGELIRCIGNLTNEAYGNGNRNWGERQIDMIALLRTTLLDGTFSAEREAEVGALLTRLGHHRRPDLSGDGSPHYRVNEAVVQWCLAHRDLIVR